MIVMQDCEEPSENVMATENQVVAYWEKDCLGQGILFLTDRQMIWMNPATRKGLRLPIPSIVVHAVSTSNEDFSEPCLFTMIDTAKAGVEYTPDEMDIEEDDEEEEDEVKTVAFRLIPANSAQISELFATLNKCQELNPEPDDGLSENGEMFGDDDEDEEGEEEEDLNGGNHYEEEDEMADH